MDRLLWSKGLLKSTLTVTRNAEQIGAIRWNGLLSSDAIATLKGRRFVLRREFFLSKLELYDATNQSLMASMMINLFNPRTDLILNGKRFELEIKNFWQSRWAWKFNGQEIIVFTSHEFLTKDSGSIDIFSSDSEELEILILLGLFVRNQLVLFMLFIALVVLFILI
ncbi:MAG: hypothetical protein ACK5JD_08360 [Mangrovibacterium sp.]